MARPDAALRARVGADGGGVSERVFMKPDIPEGCQLMAMLDGHGSSATWGLYVESDGEVVAHLAWPKAWPATMTAEILTEYGFNCITA